MNIFQLMGTVAINREQAVKDINGIKTSAEGASTAMGRSFTKFTGYVQKHSAQIKAAGRTMAIMGGVATAAFGVSIKAAAKFEEELANVSTMLDKSAMKIMPEYRDGIQNLSMEFGEATDTLSKGLYDILSASIAPAEALDVLAVSAKAATAGLTDTGTAADAITTIINSYGMEAKDAGIISDKLFAIVKRGKTTFGQLAPAIGRVAATAAKSGLSFDELGATIATVTRAGINTRETMTSINGVLKSFLKPQTDAIIVAKQFGLELNTTTLKTIGLTGVMEKLKDATAEQLATIFGNVRGLKGMMAALGDAEGYVRDYELMLNAAGLTQEAFEKQSDTLSFKLKQLKQTFNVVKVEIGTALIPMIQELTENLIITVGKMKEWIKANPEMAKGIAEWTLKLSAFMLVFAPFMMMLPGMVLAWPALAVGANAASGAFAALAVALGLTVAQLGFAIIGFGLLYIEIRKAWNEIVAGPSWKEIKKMAADTAKAHTTALEKLQKAYNLTNEELQYFIDNHKMVPRILNESRRVMQLTEADTRAMATANRDYVETVKQQRESLEDLDSAIAVSIITGGELSEQQEEYMERRKRMSDLDRTATQRKIDDLDLECVALINNMETNLMTMQEIDDYRSVMLEHIVRESSERQEHLSNMEEVERRLYELTHTAVESRIRDLELERDARIDAAKQAYLSAEAMEEAVAKYEEIYDREKTKILEVEIARVEKEIASINEAIERREAAGEAIDDLIEKRNAEIENLKGLEKQYEGTAVAAEKLAIAEQKKKVYKVLDAEGKMIGIRSQQQLSQEEAAAGVTLVEMAGGGLVRTFMKAVRFLSGGGSTGTDTVPIMATPGEYVVDKPMTDFIRATGLVTGGLVDAIVKGLPTPPPPARFVGGGMVARWGGSSPASGGVSFPSAQKSGKWEYNINFNNPVVRSEEDLAELRELVEEVVAGNVDVLDTSGNEIGA